MEHGVFFPLLVLYDDSLHNRWQHESIGGSIVNTSAAYDMGRLREAKETRTPSLLS